MHVWGCVVSYGLTKAERMTTEHKKLSALTMEFYFGGMSGNMVLLVHQKTFVVHQGNAQKCHFYEGIFTERTPPKQSNPLGLLELLWTDPPWKHATSQQQMFQQFF